MGQGSHAAQVDHAGNAILQQGHSACALAGACLEEVAAGGYIQNMRNSDAHMALALAADDDNDLAFGVAKRRQIAIGRGQHPAGILDRQQLTLEVEHRPRADVLDAGEGKLLDAQHGGQRHGGPPSGDFNEEILEALRGSGVRVAFSRARFLFVGAHGDAGLDGDRARVQNQRQIGVAKHGCARIQADVLEHGGERLDDNLLGIGQSIHDQAETPPVGIENGDETVPLRGRLVLPLGHQQPVEKDQRQQLATQPVKRRALHPLDGGSLLGRHVHQLRERSLRKGEALVHAADDEGRNDGQRERNPHPQRGALTGAGVDFDFAADLLHVGADHIHPHPAPAHVGNGSGGGEAGHKDKLQQLALGELRGTIGRNQPALDGLLADLLDGNAGAVVGDLDDDVAALLAGAQLQRSLGVFSCRLAHFGRLDAVIERVPDRVGERVLDGFEQALVQFGVLALHLQPDAAAERLR